MTKTFAIEKRGWGKIADYPELIDDLGNAPDFPEDAQRLNELLRG